LFGEFPVGNFGRVLALSGARRVVIVGGIALGTIR